jgi:hypothetical protein
MPTITEIINRKEPLIAIGSISFIIGLIRYFFSVPGINEAGTTISEWAVVIGYFGSYLGILVFFRGKIKDVTQMRSGVWYYSALSMGLCLITATIGLGLGAQSQLYKDITGNLYGPVAATAKAIVSFYGISASYRAFRTRNLRSIVAIVLAILIMFRMSTLGELISPEVTPIADWFTDVVMAAGYRAFIVAAAFGSILLGIRLVLGRELRIFGRVEDIAQEAK